MYEIRQVRMGDGEVLYLLADRKTGLPDVYVIRYVVVTIRPSGASSNTIRHRLRGIMVGMTMMRELDIDIERRIAAGRYLDSEELHQLAERCRRRSDGAGVINGQTAADRYATFVDYFAFRTDELMQFLPESDHRMIAKARKDFRDRAARHKPRPSEGAALNERLGLESHLRDLLLGVITPGDPRNPFWKSLQVRNHAIVLLTFTLGLRSGEEFALKRVDYDTRSTPAMLTIHRRPDDVDETRKEPALAKTHGRMLPLEGAAREALDRWLEERSDRARYPLARKHPYIFVSRDGGPITLRRGRQIYEQIREAYPELAGLVQHVLRHDANDRWTEHDEATGADPELSRRQRVFAFGWSENSKMPDRYDKAAVRRSTIKRVEKIQKDAIGKKQT